MYIHLNFVQWMFVATILFGHGFESNLKILKIKLFFCLISIFSYFKVYISFNQLFFSHNLTLLEQNNPKHCRSKKTFSVQLNAVVTKTSAKPNTIIISFAA